MGAISGTRWVRDTPFRATHSVVLSHRSVVGPSGSSTSRTRTSGKRGGRKGYKPQISGVLQPALFGPQKERHVETRARLISSKSVRFKRIIQDGDTVLHPSSSTPQSMGRILGSNGCLLSCPDTSKFKEAATVLPRKQSVPISGSSVWVKNRAPHLYKNNAGSSSVSSKRRLSSPTVLRRLALTPNHSSSTSDRSVTLFADCVRSRSDSQSEEVRPHSLSELHVRGNEFSDRPEHNTGSFGESSSSSSLSIPFSNTVSDIGSFVSVPARGSEFSSRFYRAGSSTLTTSSVLSVSSVASSQGLASYSASTTCSFSHRSPLVAERESVSQRSSPGTSSSLPVSHHRCEQKRVGGTSRASGPHDIRDLEPPRGFFPHQQPGTHCGSQGCWVFSFTSERPLCFCVLGQHNSSGLYQTTGGDTQSVSVSRSTETASSVSGPRHSSSSQVSPGPSQCSCRQPVAQESDSSSRMVSPPGSSQSDFLNSGSANGGSLCHQAKSPTATVCVSGSGPSCLGSGCSVPILGQDVRLCLPSVCTASPSSTESETVSVPHVVSSTTVATESLVQRAAGSSLRSSTASTVKGGSSVSERRSSASKSRPLQPSRLAVIRAGLRKKRFSSQVASIIAKARRSSTSAVYNAKWKIFTDWCVEREVNQVSPSIQHIADFLAFLFVDKKLAVSTIKGYRAMLSNTLSFRGLTTIGSDPTISELIRSFELSRPVSRSLTPKWDLSCVLWSFTKKPYEPLGKASLLHLTWKTVFLLTMASAKRRSEIHALSEESTHFRFNPDGSATFLCQMGFLAKTQLPTVASKPFTIPSLSKDLARSDPDRTLCPVRALRFYLDRVKPLRHGRKRLFIPVKGKQDVSAASISRWIASAIRLAYSELTDQDLSFLQIRPHELRALSSSWAFINNASLDDILSAASWRQASTFSTFYLRSFSASQGGLLSLGPLVAAQRVVTSQRQ